MEKANFPQLTKVREKFKRGERYKKYEHRPQIVLKFHNFRNPHFGYSVVNSGIKNNFTPTLPVFRGAKKEGLLGQSGNQHKVRTSSRSHKYLKILL